MDFTGSRASIKKSLYDSCEVKKLLNQIVLVGRIVDHVKSEEDDSSIMTLAIPRYFKNMDGKYDTDVIECRIFKPILENIWEYPQNNSVVGVRGRIQSKIVNNHRVIEVIAEKITFLQNKKEQES